MPQKGPGESEIGQVPGILNPKSEISDWTVEVAQSPIQEISDFGFEIPGTRPISKFPPRSGRLMLRCLH